MVPTVSTVYEQYKTQILLATFLAPIFGGAILYYGLRKHNEPIAKKANRFSWLSFLLWILIFGGLDGIGVDLYGARLGGMLLGVVGVVLAIVMLGKVKRATSVQAQADVFD